MKCMKTVPSRENQLLSCFSRVSYNEHDRRLANLIRGVQYVLSMMRKCIMIKVREAKNQKRMKIGEKL